MTDQGSFANIGLRWVVDQGSLSQVKQSLDSVRKNLTDLGGDAAKDSATLKQLTEDAKAIGRDATINNVAKDYVNLGKAIKDNSTALKQMQEDLKGVGAASADIDKATASFKALASAQGGSSGGGGFNVEGLRRTGGALTQLLPGSDVGPLIQRFGDLGQISKELSLVLATLAGEEAAAAGGFVALEAAISPLVTVIAPLALAIGALALIFEQITRKANDAVAASKAQFEADQKAREQAQQNRADIRSKSPQQIQQQIEDDQFAQAQLEKAAKDKRDELNKVQADYAALGSSFNPGERKRLGDLGAEKQTELNKIMDDLDKAITKTSNDITQVKPGVEQTAATAKAFKDVLSGVDTAWSALTGVIKRSNEDVAKAEAEALKARTAAIAKTQTESEKQAAVLLSIGEKYNKDDAALTEKFWTDDVAIIQKGIDEAKAITQKYYNEANAALAALYDKQASLRLNAGREEDKIARKQQLDDTEVQIKYYRQSRDDLEAHLQKIRDIEQSFKSEERDDLLDRNYRGIFQLAERKNDQRTAEDQAYADQKKQRGEALQDEQSDLQRQRQFEANERRISLQNSLNDARDNYNKQIALQAEAQEKEREQLRINTNNEITTLAQRTKAQRDILIQSRDQQIAIALQTENAKLQIQANALAQIYQQAASLGLLTDASASQGATSLSSTGQPVTRFAPGGNFRAGQPFIFNEPGSSGRETVSVGGMKFGSDRPALVYPLVGGSVDANRGAQGVQPTSITISMPISGVTDPVTVGRIAEQNTRRVIKEYFN